MAISALEGVTDEDLFNEANADEPAGDETVVEPVAEPVEPEPTTEQPEPVAEAVTDPQVKPPVDDNAAMVPSWRVREINDEKRVLADKVAALEAERPKWQQPAPQVSAPEVKVEKPDPLLDPEGYEKYLETKFEEKLLSNHRETSLQNAHKTYKGEFEEAYAAAQKQVDPVLKMKMQNSRDPGETLIEWHREQKTRAEVGNDPNAFFQKRLDAWLADPVNQATVIERARGGAQQQLQPGNGVKPAPVVSLPPSLTRTASAASNDTDDNDTSNEGLWRHANA